MRNTVVKHVPVLLEESLDYLFPRPGGIYVDSTVGLGGHSKSILERLQGKGKLIGLDRDLEALRRARERLKQQYQNFEFLHANFKKLPHLLSQLEIEYLDGCLVDLGVSSFQLDSPQRGFGFGREGPLDMRMDPEQKISAATLVNELPESKLAEIFWRYGEEKEAKKVAAALIRARKKGEIRTTTQLAELIKAAKRGRSGPRLHPATKVFQALRIEVNQELSGLEQFFISVIDLLAPQGRLVVIAFQSLEDRIVKRTFRREAGRCICFRPAELCLCPRLEKVHLLTRKPRTPSEEELRSNPRARSAKLRAVERTHIKETSAFEGKDSNKSKRS